MLGEWISGLRKTTRGWAAMGWITSGLGTFAIADSSLHSGGCQSRFHGLSSQEICHAGRPGSSLLRLLCAQEAAFSARVRSGFPDAGEGQVSLPPPASAATVVAADRGEEDDAES